MGHGGVQALAHGHGACGHGDAPIGRHTHAARFKRPAACALDAVGKAQPDVAALRPRGLLALPEPGMVHGLEHRMLGAQVVPAVEHQMPA